MSDADAARAPVDQVRYLTGPAGSVTIHNRRTLHSSARNNSDVGRPLLLNVYSSADAFPYTATRSSTGIRDPSCGPTRALVGPCSAPLLAAARLVRRLHLVVFALQQEEQ